MPWARNASKAKGDPLRVVNEFATSFLHTLIKHVVHTGVVEPNALPEWTRARRSEVDDQ
jgi:hypothetical protein